MIKFLITNLILFLTFTINAEERPVAANTSFLNGHNLTATSDLLKPGSCAVGIDIAACGVNKKFTLGTSTWLLKDYNMLSVAGRFFLDQDSKHNRWGLQLNYFKTFNNPNVVNGEYKRLGNYQMESFWLMLVRTLNIAKHFRMHLNFHVNYYWDQKYPFSLRRPSMNKTPWQLNATMLNEIDLIDGWFVFFEMGLLDFTRNPLHVHGGSSIGKVWDNFSFHIGASLTTAVEALDKPTVRNDYQQRLRGTREGYNGDLDSDLVKYDYSIHPEFSLQYVF